MNLSVVTVRRVWRTMVLVGLVMGASVRAGYPQPQYLTDDQLRETLAGHTLAGKGWAEFYQRDGTIQGRLKAFGVAYDGKWSVSDGKICYDYQGTSQDTCSRLTRDGDIVSHFTLDGSPKPDGVARRVEGNRTSSL
jgi:hypothetical protein